MIVAAARVWHYWISVFLIVPILLTVVALGVVYLRTVVAKRPPRQP